MSFTVNPVGVVHSPIKDTKNAPMFFTESDVEGVIEVFPEYQEGLYRIDEREYIVVLFHFHKSDKRFEFHQATRKTEESKGVFSTCSPSRPNRIGMSIVRLLRVEGNKLYVKHIDIIDGTPVVDIKPFKPVNTTNRSINPVY